MQEERPILSVRDLRITFAGKDGFTAVNNISFNVGKGKTLAIVGESGSGKSLTALALMGLLPKSASMQGDLILSVNGTNSRLTTHDLQLIRGKDIGMVFQEPMSSLNPVMSIGKQLVEAILIHQKIPASAGKQLAIDWLQKVQLPEPSKMYDRYPHQLSGGQKQRVMIAMAMCNHPALLIADEPTTALDVTVQLEIIRLMHYLQQEHQSAMIFITHDLALAATIADDVLVMYKGEVMEYGAASQVLQNPQHAYTRALLACKPSPEKKGHRLPIVDDFLNNETTASVVICVVGTTAELTASQPLLAVNNLRVWFPESKNLLGQPVSYFKAVDDVSFTINKGEVLGLVGESGCGKSTLSRSLIGLLLVHSGGINFNGEDISKLPVREWGRVRRHIQMIFQDPYSSLNPRMTIGDMLMEPLKVHDIVPGSGLHKEALRLLDLVQLPAGSLSRYPHQFSGGQRQRIGIARALALRPQLLICDESVSALDVSIQAQILNLLKDLQKEFQLTYLFISHDLSVVHYISDRVMVMHTGKIVESGDADRVLKRPQDEYTRRLVEAVPQ
jgi:ABC-type glutathione transport system ATPase component